MLRSPSWIAIPIPLFHFFPLAAGTGQNFTGFYWVSSYRTSMERLTPKVWKQKRRVLKLSKILSQSFILFESFVGCTEPWIRIWPNTGFSTLIFSMNLLTTVICVQMIMYDCEKGVQKRTINRFVNLFIYITIPSSRCISLFQNRF